MQVLGRRRAIGLGAALALGAGAGGDARAADLSGVTLRVGVYRGFDATILPATGQDRFPYKVEFHEFSAGNLITQAINADALDLGSWSEIPLVFAAAARARLRVVAVERGPTTNQAVIVPKNSAARSIADLRGKRVGYIRATTAHYFLLKMLQQHGLGFGDIQAVALGMNAGATAFSSGMLDAWATYGYAIQLAEADSGARVLQNATGILSGNYLVGLQPKHEHDPIMLAVVADYLGRLNRASTILDADRPRWAKLVAPVVQVPEPLVLSYLRALDRPYSMVPVTAEAVRSCQQVADSFASAGLIPADIDVAPWFSRVLTPLLRA